MKTRKRMMVLSIDGVPHSLLVRLMSRGDMPNMSRLQGEGSLVRYNSTLPWVSSVAWSSYMTGANPGKHGIYGFVDRQPGTYKTFIPTSRNLQMETLWEYLSRQGRRVVVMNVPVTYPPRVVNGVLIGCFLSPSLEKAVYPSHWVDKLKELDYRIDADPWLARESKARLLDELDLVLRRRAETMFYLMDHVEWDLSHCHVMETDRLHHFLWREMEEDNAGLAPRFYAFYRQLDAVIGQFIDRLPSDCHLMILSDHGFCSIQQEVYVNDWLFEQGWLRFQSPQPKSLADISADALAYSLDPGRIYLHVRGREPNGQVSPGAEYEALRATIAGAALELKDPQTGTHLFQAAFKREELYHGPCLEGAADLILQPTDGYDPKGALAKGALFGRDAVLDGMHTYDDALLFIRGESIKPGSWSVMDAAPTILKLMGLPVPEYMDGQTVL